MPRLFSFLICKQCLQLCNLCHFPALLLLSTHPQHNDVRVGMDINVTGVWEHNITGTGVTVVVVDDGVQHTLQDIQPNYVSFMLATSRLIFFLAFCC